MFPFCFIYHLVFPHLYCKLFCFVIACFFLLLRPAPSNGCVRNVWSGSESGTEQEQASFSPHQGAGLCVCPSLPTGRASPPKGAMCASDEWERQWSPFSIKGHPTPWKVCERVTSLHVWRSEMTMKLLGDPGSLLSEADLPRKVFVSIMKAGGELCVLS